jgi:two-component system response regulator FixJ
MSALSGVYVVDDDETVRSSLTALLLAAGNATRAYEGAREFLDDCDDLAPGCVLTDFRMPGMDGLELLRRLKNRSVSHSVILISGYGDIRVAVEAFKAGAVDFIQKPYDDCAVLVAVQKALVDAEEPLLRQATQRRFEAALGTLSRREREVMQYVVEGKSNKVIAQDLGISPRTVEIHRAHLMLKLGSHSIAGLVRMALISGFSADHPTPVEQDRDRSARTAHAS